MNPVLAPPTPTAFDVVTTAITAAAYLLVAAAAVVTAPRDVRARLFLAVAALNLGPAAGALVLWREGTQAAYTKSLVTALSITTFMGSLALFHFTQVFPRRRPWIAFHWRWLWAGYVAVPAATAALVGAAPDSMDDLTMGFLIVGLAVELSLVGFIGVFVPLAGLTSLYKSYLEARTEERIPAARATFWMLVSQLGGGVLAAILLPLLHMLSVPVAWTTIASAVFFSFGILMPLAYAAAVWKFRLLDASTAA